MANQPNILFLMTDQMQGRVLDADHVCLTPNFDRLAARGVRIRNAYTPNPVCSPARASLMTGLLPHNHGMLYVSHTVDDDQGVLRTEHLHWAQRMADAGYRTGYFGKWHVERSEQLERFGWQEYDLVAGPMVDPSAAFSLEKSVLGPAGYTPSRFYGVCDAPPQARGMGRKTDAALRFLDGALSTDQPWCCFVSVLEPHDPFYCGEAAFAQYDVDAIELQPNVHDDLADRPGIYRKSAQVWADWSDREHRAAAACYYASISEIDEMYGRLIARIEAAGQLDNTVIVLTSDHGELLGAHGQYCKNFTAAEEIYNIPMVVAGPGIAVGEVNDARVGLHDLCPTLLELTGCESIESADSRSFAPLLREPARAEAEFQRGYAEYSGTRMTLTQRVVWDGRWKFVFNGFDFDELYDLATDPYEMRNLAADPACEDQLRTLAGQMWERIHTTGDHSLANANYPPLRVAPFGPSIADGMRP